MSSSLKARLKRSSRGFSSPLLRTCSPLSLLPTSSEEIEGCQDKETLKKFHASLTHDLLLNQERLRKLKLVKQHYMKNKPEDLTLLIGRWLKTSQQALRRLFELMPEPKPPDFPSFVSQLQIDYDMLRYDPHTDSFTGLT